MHDGVADGSIDATIDADTAAVLVLGLARGVGVQLMSATPPDPSVQSVIDAAKRTVLAALRAPNA